ncbi:MAG: response regulator [Desulfobacterales bacterium]
MARILVIDDDKEIRNMLKTLLERAGHEITEAADGRDGIEKFRTNSADLIITDVVMPEKDGIEVILELKREFPDIRIIVISGGGIVPPEYYLECVKGLGATYTLEKPFDVDRLLTAVEMSLK